MNHRRNNMKVWLFGLSAGLSFLLLITAGSINSTEIQEQDADSNGFTNSYFAYAIFFGLDPTNLDETCLDYDGDQLNNREESVKLTDPFFHDTDRDLFPDNFDLVPVSRAYIQWGNSHFTTGDQYEYAHPDWLLGAYKNGGEWVEWYASEYGSNGVTVSSGWRVSAHGSNDIASLNIDLDRTILTNNLRYAVHYEGRATASGRAVINSSLYVDLLDTNGVVVAGDLYGNFALPTIS